jgi:hypothetical protein
MERPVSRLHDGFVLDSLSLSACLSGLRKRETTDSRGVFDDESI